MLTLLVRTHGLSYYLDLSHYLKIILNIYSLMSSTEFRKLKVYLNINKGGGRISKQNRPMLFSLLEHIRKCTELSKKMC